MNRARPGGVSAVQADRQASMFPGHADAPPPHATGTVLPPAATATVLPPALALTATPILWRGRSTLAIGTCQNGAMQIKAEAWLTGALPARAGQPAWRTQAPLP